MQSEFNLCKSGSCGVTVVGLEVALDSYLPEDSVILPKRHYKFSETVVLNAICSVTKDNESTLVDYKVVTHNSEFLGDTSEFTFEQDGIYTAYHAIIPTKQWLDQIIENPDELGEYDTVVYYEPEDGLFYLYGEVPVLIDVEDILSTTADSSAIVGLKITFNLCFINACLAAVVDGTLKSLAGGKCPTNEINKMIQQRDILWMAISAIKYAIDLRQFFEASRILERISMCNSLCETIKSTGSYDCGCRK